MVQWLRFCLSVQRLQVQSLVRELRFPHESESVSHSVLSDSLWSPSTTVRQALLSVGFSRQEYLSGLPFLSPGNLPDSGVEPRVSYTAGIFFTIWVTGEAPEDPTHTGAKQPKHKTEVIFWQTQQGLLKWFTLKNRNLREKTKQNKTKNKG